MATENGTTEPTSLDPELSKSPYPTPDKQDIHIEAPEDLDLSATPKDVPQTAPAEKDVAAEPKEERVLQFQDLAVKAFLIWIAFLGFTVVVFWLWSWELFRSVLFGLLVGLGTSLLYRWNIKRKVAKGEVVSGQWYSNGRKDSVQLLVNDSGLGFGQMVGPLVVVLGGFGKVTGYPEPWQLNLVPGRRGMELLLRQIPTWLRFAESEKVDVSAL